MRAAVYHGRADLRFEDVPEPRPGPGQVKIRVAANGLCGTDLHLYYGGPYPGMAVPVVLGHEFAGVVTELGEGVTGLGPGDAVAVEPLHPCGRCAACAEGRYNLCSAMEVYGFSVPGGGLAEYSVIARTSAHLLPPGIDPALGALVEPLAVAHHAVDRGALQPGHTAAVIGGGPIGIGVFLNLRAAGVERVFISEPSPTRRAALEALGATAVIDPTAGDLPAAVLSGTHGRGVDVAFECAGGEQPLRQALAATAPGGAVVVVATYEHGFDFNPGALVQGERRLIGSSTYCGDFPEVISLLASGAYPTAGWVSRIPFEKTVSEGLPALREGRATKLLVEMTGGSVQ